MVGGTKVGISVSAAGKSVIVAKLAKNFGCDNSTLKQAPQWLNTTTEILGEFRYGNVLSLQR